MLKDLLKTCRPHQWVKNFFVLAPLFFAGKLFDTDKVLLGLWGALIFSLLSSAVYFINDTLDKADDAKHPIKKNRPIAAGRIQPWLAYLCVCVLAASSLSAAFWLNTGFGTICSIYAALNLAYSVGLKRVFLLDIVIVATGFLLRVYAGSKVANVPVSPWILSCTFFLALYLALGKRISESRTRRAGIDASRRKLSSYTENWTIPAMWNLQGIIVTLYTLYTVMPAGQLLTQLSNAPIGNSDSSRLLFQHLPNSAQYLALATIPSVIFGLARFLNLTLKDDTAKSPTDRILTDWIFITNGVLWVIISAIRHYGLGA